jgi:signal transduction histidine kinase
MTEMSEVQARALAVGSVLTRLSSQDLLRIEIDVPDTGEQDALCKEDSRNSLTDADRRIIESHEEFRKDMHIKKHAIGQTLFNLNNWWDALQQAREEGNGVVSDSATTGRVRKVTVATIYDNIQKALNQLQEQISRFDRGNGLETEEVGLTDFIEKYIETHRSPMFRYEYDATRHHVQVPIFDEKNDADGKLVSVVIKGKEEDIFESATFAPEALRMVFDNIVSNACSHGFAGREDKPERNVIRIELSTEGTNHIITISNNGKPADSVVNSDFVFTYSKSTQSGKEHNGIGGYEVKRLMQEFGGEAEFVSDPESEFPVSYRLTFYNTNVLTTY